MASALDKSLDLKHYMRTLWRRKSLVLLSTVVVVCATLIALQLVPKQYVASATLSIQERDVLSLPLEAVLGGSRVNTQAYGFEEQRQARIVSNIKSRPFLEEVIRVLKMNQDAGLLERARRRQTEHTDLIPQEIAVRILIERLQSRIEVRSVGPGLYRFLVRDYDPGTARLIAHWISELFIDITTKRELDRIRAQRNFSFEQLRIYEEQVARSEAALKRYRESLIGTALEDNPVASGNLRAAERRHADLLSDEASARTRMGVRARAAIGAGFPGDDPNLREDPEVQARTDRLTDAMHAYSLGVLTATSANSPRVLQLTAELSQARTQLYRRIEERVGALYPSRDAADRGKMADYVFAQLDARVQADAASELNVLIQDYKRRVRNEPGHELELSRLTQEVQRNRDLLDSFRAQMVASDLQQAVETTDLGMRVEIVDPAQLPLEASWPDQGKILALAVLMGPLLGIGFAFLAEFLDPTLRHLEDIQRIVPEPILGTLPLVQNVLPAGRGLRRRWVPITLVGVVLLTAAFFVTRDRLFPDLGVPRQAVQAVEPVEGGNP